MKWLTRGSIIWLHLCCTRRQSTPCSFYYCGCHLILTMLYRSVVCSFFSSEFVEIIKAHVTCHQKVGKQEVYLKPCSFHILFMPVAYLDPVLLDMEKIECRMSKCKHKCTCRAWLSVNTLTVQAWKLYMRRNAWEKLYQETVKVDPKLH